MNTEDLMKGASEALKKAALNEDAKNFLLQNKALFTLLKKAANRYIAGEELTEVIGKVSTLNASKVSCTVDFMGESIRSIEEANQVTAEFLRLAREINRAQLDCTISLDLSHIGLAIDQQLAIDNLQKICDEGPEVIISAEGTDRTEMVLNTYLEISKTLVLRFKPICIDLKMT